jgi:hypothetical protein
MNGNLIAEAKSERIAYDVVFIINTLLKPFHANPEKLKKGSKSTAHFDMPTTSPLSDIYEQAATILQAYGYFVEDVTREKLFFGTRFRITILVVSNSAILLNLKNDGKYILFDNIQKEEPMTEKTTQPESKDAMDKQVGGSHYQLPIQPIEYILANGLGYCEANVVKYVSRWRNKGGIQDLKKAIHYLEMLIEQEEKDASKKS